MKELTRAEEQVMQLLWELKQAFVKELVERFPEPKPAYNTISTIVRILQEKGFVGYEAFGKSHRYYPLIEKEEYTRKYLKKFIGNYFGNSFPQMVSFFTREEDIDINELEEVLLEIKKIQQQERNNS